MRIMEIFTKGFFMTNTPSPLNKRSITRASIIGSVMAVGGIILFLILYAAMTSAGADPVQRVVVALCVPPMLMALLMGGYFFFGRRK
jgi:hypothetical protein